MERCGSSEVRWAALQKHGHLVTFLEPDSQIQSHLLAEACWSLGWDLPHRSGQETARSQVSQLPAGKVLASSFLLHQARGGVRSASTAELPLNKHQ